ncbi:MAG: CocE/NonD family hydrolase [Pseudomonadota bacterium]
MHIALAVFLSLLIGLPAGAAEPSFPSSVQARYNVPVAMRDGVQLSTDVYLPAAKGKYPTLLVRDIYGNGSAPLRQRYARWATANGYAFVLQNARGRYDSEGDWYPYFQEINDGHDTLDWIADQAWSNSKVGMFGTSYLASVQWLAALNRHPALLAIAPAMSPGNYYRDVAYPGGAFSLLSRASWGIGTVGSRTNQSYPIDWISGIRRLPINTLDRSLGFDVPHFRDWVAHPTYDEYWKPLNLEARAPEMAVPALNIGGWYDVFLRSTIGSYASMRQEAATESARRGQRLIIGPWVHGWNQREVGEVDFGPEAVIDAEALQLEWFDHWLKDGPAPAAAPVRIFVMGENVWRDEQQWPLARTQYTEMYLTREGGLESSASVNASSLTYDYDPEDPVPTRGGNIMRPELRGPFDQRPLDAHEGVLRFEGETLTAPLEITGPIRAVLWASSSAVDTDFMAKLMVVKADGRAINLVDGVLRTRFRAGFEKPALMEPGKTYRFELDLWATSYLLAAGERLRLDVTSSNYPRLARNPNTGAPFGETTQLQTATQTIHLGGTQASHLILPVIPR